MAQVTFSMVKFRKSDEPVAVSFIFAEKIVKMTGEQLLELLEAWENLGLVMNEIIAEPANYRNLVEIALNSNHPKSWRAAWLMDKINDKAPVLIIDYIPEIIEKLKTETSDGKKRHLLKLVSLKEIPGEYLGFLTDFCIAIFTSSKEPIAVRVHAMQILGNIAMKEPDLKPEIVLIMEHEMENHGSAGIVSRCKKILRKLV